MENVQSANLPVFEEIRKNIYKRWYFKHFSPQVNMPQAVSGHVSGELFVEGWQFLRNSPKKLKTLF